MSNRRRLRRADPLTRLARAVEAASCPDCHPTAAPTVQVLDDRAAIITISHAPSCPAMSGAVPMPPKPVDHGDGTRGTVIPLDGPDGWWTR